MHGEVPMWMLRKDLHAHAPPSIAAANSAEHQIPLHVEPLDFVLAVPTALFIGNELRMSPGLVY